MAQCPTCSAEVSQESRFCSSCGSDLAGLTAAQSRPGPDSHSSLLDQGRFAPGTMVTGRYRIVGLLGRGGMGEVYRADDLKLGQSVALKFLPTDMERDQHRLNLLLNEVRLARQVSHPNVCRVYDIGEFEEAHFMAMEYVDGEDLSSLLRRIGRLPQEKGIEIGRQICAGLAAAHELGILHRDLKPANVMIDGRGRVKLTDFGLSGLAERIEGEDARVGTPAYMSPEQLAGREATQSSDIYALGLVLYELFTGKRAFGGNSVAEIARMQRQTSLTSPSSLAPAVDEAVERVILRCLEMEPTARPSSALAVAAALPGGDPLSAALAAGETPSPEMVADASVPGSVSPLVGILALVAILASMVITIANAPSRQLASNVDLPASVDELHGDALRILENLGVEDPGAHRRRGMAAWEDPLKWIASRDSTTGRWDALADGNPPVALFWFRYSNATMIPERTHAFVVLASDPAVDGPGDGRLWLDPEGRLLSLERIVDPLVDSNAGPGDPAPLFAAARLDPDRFVEIEPPRAPQVPATEVRAWRGPVFDDIEGVVLAGWIAGTPTAFEVVGPWDLSRTGGDGRDGRNPFGFFVFLAVIIGTAFLVRNNLRSGRADTRGAGRLALFYIGIVYLIWIVCEVRLDTFAAGSLALQLVWGHVAGHAFIHAVIVGLFYLALEPYVRRLWPAVLVSWSRLVVGRVRDPLLGRDVLLGMAIGAISTSISVWGESQLLDLAGVPVAADSWTGFGMGFDGLRYAVAQMFMNLESIVAFPMMLLVFLVLLRLLLRRNWATFVVFTVIFAAIFSLEHAALTEAPAWIRVAFTVNAIAGLLVFLAILFRLGLMAAMGGALMGETFDRMPLTSDLGDWYAGSMVLMLAGILAIALWAFFTALGGRKLFRDSVLD